MVTDKEPVIVHVIRVGKCWERSVLKVPHDWVLVKFPATIGLDAIPYFVRISTSSDLRPERVSVRISENPNQELSPIST